MTDDSLPIKGSDGVAFPTGRNGFYTWSLRATRGRLLLYEDARPDSFAKKMVKLSSAGKAIAERLIVDTTRVHHLRCRRCRTKIPLDWTRREFSLAGRVYLFGGDEVVLYKDSGWCEACQAWTYRKTRRLGKSGRVEDVSETEWECPVW